MTNLSATMVPATNFEKMIEFYKSLGNLEIQSKTDDYVVLKNPRTQESICVTNGHSLKKPSAGFKTDNIRDAIGHLESLGGKVQKMVATCIDPEGNEIMVWQDMKTNI